MTLLVLLIHLPEAAQAMQTIVSEGHQCEEVEDYAAALEQLSQRRFDIVLTPPGTDHWPLSRLTQAARRFGVSVWLAADSEHLQRLQTEPPAQVDDYLQWPAVEVVLRQRLRQFQERRGLQSERLRLETMLRENSWTDSLTHLLNRHFAIQNLSLQWNRYRRHRVPFCCILCDLDDFKKANGSFGQRFGDEALRAVANCLREQARASDLVCRYDGQTFFVLCSDTLLAGAKELAERLGEAISNLKLRRQAQVTASFAIVQSGPDFASADALLQSAEELLARAKLAGSRQLQMLEPPC